MLLAAAALLLAGSAGIALVVGSSLRDARIQDVLPSVRPVPSPVGTPLPSGSSATPKPTRASTASPSPGLGGFVTPIPPDAETVWTGISWRKLEATDPLAYVRSVTRWRGGYVAVGDPGGDQRSGATPVWVSADGGTWSQLDSAVFGPATRVLGVGETAAGLVTLTMQGGWPPSPPLQAWTSSDGVAWTPHPGPALGPAEELPTFRAGPAGLVVAIRAGTGAGGAGQVAISRDGVAWEILSANAFPAGWRRVEAMEATPSGFIAVGSATAKTGTQTMIALSSTEARLGEPRSGATPGSTQSSAASSADPPASSRWAVPVAHRRWTRPASTAIWWSSLDGRMETLPKYPPLEPSGAGRPGMPDACPDETSSGTAADVRVPRPGKQIGWTSLTADPATVTFEGGRPEKTRRLSVPVVILPIGVLLQNQDGSTGSAHRSPDQVRRIND